MRSRVQCETGPEQAGQSPELLEVSDGHFAMNAAYPGERKEFVREPDVLRLLRVHLYR